MGLRVVLMLVEAFGGLGPALADIREGGRRRLIPRARAADIVGGDRSRSRGQR